jgi:hypothetical protein
LLTVPERREGAADPKPASGGEAVATTSGLERLAGCDDDDDAAMAVGEALQAVEERAANEEISRSNGKHQVAAKLREG